eukprot:6181142-Pleurochrysis_carterae.AAC.1
MERCQEEGRLRWQGKGGGRVGAWGTVPMPELSRERMPCREKTACATRGRVRAVRRRGGGDCEDLRFRPLRRARGVNTSALTAKQNHIGSVRAKLSSHTQFVWVESFPVQPKRRSRFH